MVALSIENSQSDNTEVLEATLSSINSTVSLKYPLKITLSKSKVTARYPLNYLQDFNNKAQELLIAKSMFTCDDGPTSDTPTCGWKYDAHNKRIWDSQGYCCTCDLTDFLGLGQGSYQRGFACEAFNLGTGSSTAFCLVWDSLWYSAYEILQYQIDYTVTVTVTQPDSNGNYSKSTYKLSPSLPIFNTQNARVKIIGDFAPTSPPPDLASQVLFTANSPASHYLVQLGSPYWMTLDKSTITFDGTECNKVGTSYSGFRGQSNKCSSLVGSCFQNQLDDLHKNDVQRQNSNQAPLHFISRYGNFSMVNSAEIRYLEMQLAGSYPSMVTLELNADSLKFITTVSKGVIDIVSITNFEAITLDGNLLVQISNIGNIISQFILSVLCGSGVSAIPSQSIPLGAMQTKTTNFAIYVIGKNSANYSCNVTLLNSIGEISDMKKIEFNTTEQHTDQGTQGGTGDTPKGSTSNNHTSSDLTCSDYCPTWYNLPCFLTQGCWDSFFAFFGIVIGIVVALIAIKIIIRRYGICCQKCFPPSLAHDIDNTQAVNEYKENSHEKTWKCYLNSENGCASIGVTYPVSIFGTLTKKSNGKYEFLMWNRKSIWLSREETKQCISKSPKFEVAEAHF